jgi:hypothetical protein
MFRPTLSLLTPSFHILANLLLIKMSDVLDTGDHLIVFKQIICTVNRTGYYNVPPVTQSIYMPYVPRRQFRFILRFTGFLATLYQQMTLLV